MISLSNVTKNAAFQDVLPNFYACIAYIIHGKSISGCTEMIQDGELYIYLYFIQ